MTQNYLEQKFSFDQFPLEENAAQFRNDFPSIAYSETISWAICREICEGHLSHWQLISGLITQASLEDNFRGAQPKRSPSIRAINKCPHSHCYSWHFWGPLFIQIHFLFLLSAAAVVISICDSFWPSFTLRAKSSLPFPGPLVAPNRHFHSPHAYS